MSNKNFLLLSLDDTKIKKVSNVISNESCRKILDYLSTKDATESELAEKLGLPISTVHYNLQQLMETELINSEEFHYSSKGKEVSHYKLANKYIIIAPKKTVGIKEKLKSILPVALIIGVAALIIQHTQKFFAYGSAKIPTVIKQTLVRETFISEAPGSAEVAKIGGAKIIAQKDSLSVQEAINKSVEIVNKTTEYLLPQEVTTQTITTPSSIWSNIALWFLIGAIFALIIYFFVRSLRKNID